MSEELSQKGLLVHGLKVSDYEYYNIGATTLNDLQKYKIIPQKDYGDYKFRKPDSILVDRRNPNNISVIAVVEHKKGQRFRSEKDIKEAVEQCNDVAQILNAKVGIITDTKDYLWINPSHIDLQHTYVDKMGLERSYSFIKDEQKQKLIRPFSITQKNDESDKNRLNDITRESILLIEQVMSSVNQNNSYIKAESINDPTPLAKQIWQDVWSVSGATPENCLYTFVELFIYKYLSDLGVLDKNDAGDTINFDYIYSLGEKYAFQNYSKNVRHYLKKIFPPEKPLDQGGTTIINGTVLTGGVEGHDKVFYKILGRFAKFGELKNIDPNFKSHLFESFLKESISKKNWGQFFTPRKVVRAIVGLSGIETLHDGAKICDPFCGVGGFLLEPLLNERKNDFYVENNQVKQKAYYYGYEKGFAKDEQKTVILAKANMLIFMSDLLSKHKTLTEKFANIFNDTFHLRTKSILGTLDMVEGTEEYTGKYDLILTNPPYVMSGSRNLKDAIKNGPLNEYYKTNAMGVEGLALEWIIKNLTEGGKAFVVIPDGILNRNNDNKMRKFILDECYIDCLISLPINTFFTTPKKTYILGITKKGKDQIQTDPIFTYLVSNIGETLDVNRFNIEENDLEQAKILFNQFKGAKKHFKTEDKRCKITPIKELIDNVNKHWSVDRWWTKEEKIEIGIEEEENEITKNDFIDLLKEKNKEFNILINQTEEILKKKKEIDPKEVLFKEISLADKDYFNLSIGDRVVKKDLFGNKSFDYQVPLYSANMFEPFGFLKSSNIERFENPYIIWGIDNSNFEFSIMKKGEIFATTDHCGTLEILSDKIHPEYLLLALYQKKYQMGFGRSLRANLKNMALVQVEIPVDSNGFFCLEKQKEIAQEHKSIGDLQKKVLEIRAEIESIRVDLSDEYECKEVNIEELFRIEKGQSKYTKGYGNLNQGEYPVYSASNNAPLCYINHYDYDGTYLTWATNGFGGYIKVITGKFSVNGDRGVLIPLSNKIDIHFIRFILQPILRGLAKGRKGDNGKNEFTKVPSSLLKSVFLKMPVRKDGEFDVMKQNEIAEQYATVENIKDKFIQQLDSIGSYKVYLE